MKNKATAKKNSQIIFKRPGISLIIVIMIMLVLGVLAWTLAGLVSTNLEMGSRMSDSEKALYVAEAGARWAQKNATCAGGGSLTVNHTFPAGEYNVICSGSTIVSTGYVPSQSACGGANCLGQRKIQQTVGSSNSTFVLNSLLYAYKDFDWSGVNTPGGMYNSRFDGNISVGNITSNGTYGFERDGDVLRNEAGVDYRNDTNPLPPCGSSFSPAPTRTGNPNYPAINLDWLCNNASDSCYWPDPGAPHPTVLQKAQAMDRNLRVCFATFNLGNMWLVNNDLGQSFNVAGSGTYVVDNVRVMHGPNYFIPQGNVTLSIYNNNAGSNTPNAPVSASATKTYTPAPSSWNTVNLTSSVTLNKGATYWLVLNDTATEQPETRYTVRAGYYNGPQSLLFRPPSQAWDTNDRQDEPELLFEIRQGTTVQAGANQSRIYNRSLPMPLGDIANNEYDCAEAFMIRPWWPSTTVTGITTYHRLDTNNPTNDWITVTIQRDGGSFVASTGILTLPTGLPGANTPVRINYSSGGSSWSDELRTSTDVTHVSVNPSHLPVSSVSGVWLQSDALHTKTNYYSGPSGTILGTAQYKSPNAATSVSANFNSSVVLNYDTKYWLVWDAVPQATNKYYNLAAAGYKYGSHTYRVSGGAWQPPSEPDVMFQLNLATSGPISMTADSNFFRSPTAMDGEALKNYSLNGNWSNGEWAVISSISSGQLDYNDIVFYERMLGQTLNPDNKYAAILDRSVDWLDTDEVQLAHYVSGGSNNAENWYVAAGLVFDSSGGTVSLKTKSFATERDIGLVGDNRIELRADTGSSARALLASQFGSIYSTAPANDTTPFLTARRRTLAGLLYTQAGNVTFNSLCATDNDCPPSGSSQTGVAILGNNIKMSGYVYLDDNSTSIDRGGSYFNLTTSSVPTWQEQ